MIAHMTDDRVSIDALEARLKHIAEAELEQAFKRLPQLSDEGRHALEKLIYRIIQRVLANPQAVINAAEDNQQEALVETLQTLFDLE